MYYCAVNVLATLSTTLTLYWYVHLMQPFSFNFKHSICPIPIVDNPLTVSSEEEFGDDYEDVFALPRKKLKLPIQPPCSLVRESRQPAVKPITSLCTTHIIFGVRYNVGMF